jgi:recombination protein RecT
MGKGKEVTTSEGRGGFIESFKEKAGDMLLSYFGTPDKVSRFYASMRMCLAKTPKLATCTPDSLSTVFMTCAEVGLYPSSYTGECYVIPYNIKGKMTATFQMGYQGPITLGYRAGIKKIDAQVVYKNDFWQYQRGLNPILDHRPDVFSDDRGEPIGAYAISILASGEVIDKVMSKADIFKHRAMSQGYQADLKYNTKKSPWHPENDPQLTMWMKTCIIQLAKLMPKSPTMQQAIAADIQGNIIDVTQTTNIMTQDEIKGFYENLLANYETDDIGEAILKERNGKDTLDDLTFDESEAITKRLDDMNKAKSTDKDKKSQGELLPND